ncbi:MAG: hypothetical protein ACKN9D_11410 [Actinomycetales bacterium]
MRKRYSARIGTVLAVLGALAALANTGNVLDATVGATVLLGVGWLVGIPLDRRRARKAIDVASSSGSTDIVDTMLTRTETPLKAFMIGGLRVGLTLAVVIGLVGISASAFLYSEVQSLTGDLADVANRARALESRARGLESRAGDIESQLQRRQHD